MNILFVDDNEISISSARDYLEEKGHDCAYSDFNSFDTNQYEYDIIVIDMMNGSSTDDPQGSAGNNMIQKIWDSCFCPIIIYSANPDLCQKSEHPFIGKVTKKAGAEQCVEDEISKFFTYLCQRKELKEYIDDVINNTLRDTAPTIFKSETRIEDENIFLRMLRRRIAVAMDNGVNDELMLSPCEQYIYPCINDDWLQGDVIQNNTDKSYYLVLTPSCDLVKRDGKIKTRSILCAKCKLYNKSCILPYLKVEKDNDCEMCTSDHCSTKHNSCAERKKEKFAQHKTKAFVSMLNSGIVGKYFVLPGLDSIMPDLLADLKNLSVISPNEMDNYDRIVSIDSPFREQLSWVFVSVAGRPGMPDRDFETWALQNI